MSSFTAEASEIKACVKDLIPLLESVSNKYGQELLITAMIWCVSQYVSPSELARVSEEFAGTEEFADDSDDDA